MGELLDYGELAAVVTNTTSARQFFIGGVGVLVFAIVVPMTIDTWKAVTGEIPVVPWSKHVATAAFFGLLLAGYELIFQAVTVTFQSLGTFGSASSGAEALFEARIQAVQTAFNALESGGDETTFGLSFSVDALYLGLQRFVVVTSMYFTLAVIFCLRQMQTFMLALLLNIGPVCIGIAAIGGIFRSLLLSWFWALVEICFWGVAMNVALQSFAQIASPVGAGAEPDLMMELATNIVYGASLSSIPVFSAMIVRSQPATAMSSRVASAATGIAAGPMGMLSAAQRATQTGKSVSGSSAKKAEAAGNGSIGRAGEALGMRLPSAAAGSSGGSASENSGAGSSGRSSSGGDGAVSASAVAGGAAANASSGSVAQAEAKQNAKRRHHAIKSRKGD